MGPRGETPLPRPDIGSLSDPSAPPPEPRSRTARSVASAVVYAVFAVVWYSSFAAAMDPSSSAVRRLLFGLLALGAFAAGSAFSSRAFAVASRSAAERTRRAAIGVAVGSILPVFGAFAALFVPYLIGLALASGRTGRVRARIAYVAAVAVLAAFAEVFWILASEGL
jgi:hypothetical protein